MIISTSCPSCSSWFKKRLPFEQGVVVLLEKERSQIVRFAKKLLVVRLTSGTGGNQSIFDREGA